MAVVMSSADNFIMIMDGHATHYEFYSDTAPVGDDIDVIISKNGTTVDTITITDGDNTVSGDDLSLTYLRGDRIGFKVNSVGSTTAGGDDLYAIIY